MNRRSLALVSGVLFALASCAPIPVVRVGLVVYDYSKGDNIEGFSTDKAAQLAVKQLNEGGTFRLELVPVLVTEAPETSVDAVRLLANNKHVDIIVGPSSSRQAIPAGQAAEEAKVPLITSVSSNPATTAGRAYVFRMCYLDPDQAAAQVKLALPKLEKGSASLVVYESDPSSHQQGDLIEAGVRQGGKLVRKVLHLAADDPDFDRRIAEAGPWTDNVVFLPNSSSFSAKAARSLRAHGFRGLLVGGDGWDRTEMAANPDFDGGIMTTNYWSGQTTDGNASFVAAYQAFAGRLPGDTAALTYDAIGMIASVVRRTGKTDAESLRSALADGTPYVGIAGTISYHGSGDPQRSVVLLTFRGGQVLPGGTL